MKLQTKLIFRLIGGLFVIYLISFLFQESRSLGAIGRFSSESRALEKSDMWQWIDRLEFAIRSPLIEFMAAGEMDMFDKTITSQRNVAGLQEFSLYDADGKMVNSTEQDRKGKTLRDDLMQEVRLSQKTVKKLTGSSFEIYEPLLAEKRCLKCHENWKEGQVTGVLALRFSSDALKDAAQKWTGFEDDFRKSNMATAALTAIGLMLGAGLLIGFAVRYMVALPINLIGEALTRGSDQVATASGKLSTASQTLADGASEQAATLEETSASLEEISSMTKRNAKNAHNAKDLSSQTRHAAETGSANMLEMSRAMTDIQSASSNISKINRTIDEIAFQTNILALNAAVEAARAGEAGAGFAVVADEVRKLAQRCAQAAKETAEKIEDSITKSAAGVATSAKVTESLDLIVSRARQVDEIVAEIATASHEQSQGISQVNTAVTQIDKVTQTNAASAEESASASEKLSAQAAILRKLVAELQQLVTG